MRKERREIFYVSIVSIGGTLIYCVLFTKIFRVISCNSLNNGKNISSDGVLSRLSIRFPFLNPRLVMQYTFKQKPDNELDSYACIKYFAIFSILQSSKLFEIFYVKLNDAFVI